MKYGGKEKNAGNVKALFAAIRSRRWLAERRSAASVKRNVVESLHAYT